MQKVALQATVHVGDPVFPAAFSAFKKDELKSCADNQEHKDEREK